MAGMTPPFAINVGVHQGSASSPLLFIFCMDTVTANLQSPYLWSLLFADDGFLANEQHVELKEEAQQRHCRLGEYGLHLSTEKTEYMECSLQTDGPSTSGPKESATIQVPPLYNLQRRRVSSRCSCPCNTTTTTTNNNTTNKTNVTEGFLHQSL